jgi:hypothetical protein
MTHAILAALMALPAAVDPSESDVERVARYEVIAHAIESASLAATCQGPYSAASWCVPVWQGPRIDLVSLLITEGWWESKFLRRVGAGRCWPNECDAVRLRDGRIYHRSRHYWQLQQSTFVPKEAWLELVGIEYEPTTLAAYSAAVVLGEGLKRCRSVSGAIAFYAQPRSCGWSGATARNSTFEYVRGRLRADAGTPRPDSDRV